MRIQLHKGGRGLGGLSAFTLVEILIAVGLLGLVLAAICSSWTAILRASKVGQDAAAAVQRARFAVHTIEDALLGVQSFAANQPYYAFYAENGTDGRLSFVARLPQSFPRSGRFGDLDVRRLEFSVQAGSDGNDLVLRQKPYLMGEDFMDWDEDEKNYPLVLAKYVSDFQVEFYDKDKKEWLDKWTESKTNQLPQLVRFSMKLADSAQTAQKQEEITRIINLPAQTVRREWQTSIGRAPGPGNPQPLQPGQPGQPGGPQQPLPQPNYPGNPRGGNPFPRQ
jgi:type II secretory pathway pseudopilin PulG